MRAALPSPVPERCDATALPNKSFGLVGADVFSESLGIFENGPSTQANRVSVRQGRSRTSDGTSNTSISAGPALMGRYGSARAGAASRDADADTIPLLHGEPSSVSSTRVGDGRHIRWALGVVAMSWLGVLCTLQVFGPHGVVAFVATAPRPGVTLGAAAIPPPKAASSKPAAGGGGHAEPPHDTTTTAPHHAHTTDARAKEGGASNGGQLSVPLVIGDNAVFQRAPESAAVWGWAPPGTTVTVQIIAPSASGDLGTEGGGAAKAPSDDDDASSSEDPNQHHPTEARDADGKFADHWVLDLGGSTRAMATAVTDSTGSWTARLPPIQASYNLQLVISSPGMQSITRNNVAFGEVW